LCQSNLKDLPVQGNHNEVESTCLDSPVNAGRWWQPMKYIVA